MPKGSGKKVYTKIGVVMRGDKGNFVALGASKNKNAKYNFSVDITVRNADGDVVHQQTDGFLSLFDPRKRPGISEGDAEKIPEKIRFELFSVKEE